MENIVLDAKSIKDLGKSDIRDGKRYIFLC